MGVITLWKFSQVCVSCRCQLGCISNSSLIETCLIGPSSLDRAAPWCSQALLHYLPIRRSARLNNNRPGSPRYHQLLMLPRKSDPLHVPAQFVAPTVLTEANPQRLSRLVSPIPVRQKQRVMSSRRKLSRG